MTATADGTIERFFRDYGRAATANDPAQTASFYAAAFIAAGPAGSGAFPNNEQFLAWLRRVFDFNLHTGMQSLALVEVESRQLSGTHAIATVTWGARFAKTGEALVEFQVTYLLEDFGGGWKILAYVDHVDQEAELRRLGLIA